QTFWDGAGAEDVERLVTRRIEEEIEDISGVRRIISDSQPGASFIDVKFDEDLDASRLETAFNDLRTALDRVADLPEDVEPPILRRLTTSEVWPLFSVVVSTSDPDLPEIVLREAARELKRILGEVEGVQKVSPQSFRDRELLVRVDRLDARRHGVSLMEIIDALRRTNRSQPAGSLSGSIGSPQRPSAGEREEVRLHFDTEYDAPREIEEAVIRIVPGRSPLRVKDIARVEVGFEKERLKSRINGQRAMVLNIAKDQKSDTLRLRDRCWEEIQAFQRRAPASLRFEIVGDQSEVVRSRFKVLLENLLQGVIIVSLILFFSLGLRNALIALVGIPFSYLSSFLLFPLLGMSINNLTLFGMVLVGGMLVDDAIVVIENIYRYIEEGLPPAEAVRRGAREVAWPVFNACATTVAAMLPLLIQSGMIGRFFAYIPKVVILALFFSVAQCITVLPVHYLEFGSRRKTGRLGPIRRLRAAFFGAARGAYVRLLSAVLRYRAAFLSLVVGGAVLLAGLVLQIRQDPWSSDFNAVFSSIQCDSSFSLDETDDSCREVEELLDDLYAEGLIKNYYTIAGFRMTADGIFIRRPNVGFFMATLADIPEVASDPERIVRRLRGALDERIARRGARGIESFEVFTPHDGPPLGKPVAVRVECNDYRRAKLVAEEIKAELRRMEGVYGVADNLDLGPREFRFEADAERSAALALFPLDLALAVRAANDGIPAGSYKDRGLDEDVTIRVEYEPGDRGSVADILQTDIPLPSGALLPVVDVSRVDVWRPNASYYHYDARRTVLVTADVDGLVATGPQVNERLEKMFRDVPQRHPGVRIAFGGEFEETAKSMAGQRRSFWIALVLIYVLLAAQFRCYRQPLIVMAVVPFGVLGVLLGLWIRDQPFTMATFIAMIGLAGVVVNDSLVLVEFINLERARGRGLLEAVISAASQRLRPVLLTAATTAGNLLPLALGLGGVSRVWTPFAVSIVFGIAVASAMTLLMVPVLYSLIVRR
ncbi:MAG: efflux RND transporter permease subunit, partial [Planctomycetes bacterium]|nr:efflux RND transporter permease subunit [Planctomycetota bacterium]